MSHIQLTAQGINVISLSKGKSNFGMTCAWATQVDYDKIIMLIGGQSETGKELEINGKVGFSALNNEQIDIAIRFGTSHSLNSDKFGQSMELIDGVPVVKNATREIVGKVISINNYDGDLLVTIQVENMKTNSKPFLTFDKMPKY